VLGGWTDFGTYAIWQLPDTLLGGVVLWLLVLGRALTRLGLWDCSSSGW
jgi:hypothetical protein